jgi:hypothetical protein
VSKTYFIQILSHCLQTYFLAQNLSHFFQRYLWHKIWPIISKSWLNVDLPFNWVSLNTNSLFSISFSSNFILQTSKVHWLFSEYSGFIYSTRLKIWAFSVPSCQFASDKTRRVKTCLNNPVNSHQTKLDESKLVLTILSIRIRQN